MSILKYSQIVRNTFNSFHKLSICASQQPGIPECCVTNHLRKNGLISAVTQARSGSTFTNMSLDQLWEGATGVSNAGKKKGRGKRGSVKKRVNIHIGKTFGHGLNRKYLYPGLNVNLMTGSNSEIVKMSSVPRKAEDDQRLLDLRKKIDRFAKIKKFPLERGWSGARIVGMSVGKPDPYQEYNFDEFDSRVLEFKLVSHMTGNLGRKHSYSVLVVIGNGKGLVGTGLAKSSVGNPALRKAKNAAAQRLQFINLKDNRTIWHEFYSEVGKVRIFATPKPEGHGLVCHRAIRTIAQCIGIKDLYAKVEGRTKNIQHVTEAFISGLLKQETHQELADKSKYYVVELSDTYNVPTVLAEPNDGEVEDTAVENFDLGRHYMGGTVLKKPPKVMFYEKYPQFKRKRLKTTIKMRNQKRLHIQRQAAAME